MLLVPHSDGAEGGHLSSEAGGATCTALQHLLGGGIQMAVLCPHVGMNGSLFLVSRGYNTQ